MVNRIAFGMLASAASAAILATCAGAHESNVQSGVRFGVHWSRLSFETLPEDVNNQSRPGVAGETYFKFQRHRNFAIEVAFGVAAQGGRVGYHETVDPLRGGDTDVEETFKFTYLNIPVLLEVFAPQAAAQPYFKFGPQLSIELAATKEIAPGFSDTSGRYRSNDPGFVTSESIERFTRDVDFGLYFAAGVGLPVRAVNVFVETRFVLGLTDLGQGNDSDEYGSISNRVFGLMLGVAY